MKHTLDNLEGLFIGDICYALEDDVYYTEWGTKHNFQDGLITTENNLQFAVAGTYFGDGLYYDEYFNEYPVDAGVIGVVDLRLATKYNQEELNKLGLVIPEANKVEFDVNEGIFYITAYKNNEEIKNITIDTFGNDEWDDEEDDDGDWYF